MIPLYILSKLVQSRSQMALATKTFLTSKSRWREKGEFSGNFKKCPPSGDSKREDKRPGKQGKDCNVKEDKPKHSKEHDVTGNQCGPSEVDAYLERKKQGVRSSCGSSETTNKYFKETCKPRGFEPGDSPKKSASSVLKSRSCSCGPYDTPKYVKETGYTQEQKPMAGCEEIPKERNECASKQINNNPCEIKNLKCPENSPKRACYCGPGKTSYTDSYPDEKDNCLKEGKQSIRNQEIKCGERIDPCGPTKTSTTGCPKVDDCANVNKVTTHDSCETREKNKCPVLMEDECLDNKTQNTCPENRPKKEIKIPELSPCCKEDAANKCICKLKEIEREWEKVVATQEREGKDECQKNMCSEVKERGCLDEQKQNPCSENRLKKEIKIPVLPQCCKVDAAKECICKLKELEREWEEVVAAQEREGKDECLKNTCPEVKEEKCLDAKNQNPGPEERPCPKKEIKIPELSPCCKVDAAQSCICKLKDLEREWVKVIATQEKRRKDECLKSQESGKACRESPMRSSSSNLIYVVLAAILAAVMYYTYNEDFETEELFLKNEEIDEEDADDDD